MIKHTKVDKKNLRYLYNSERGNLYFKTASKKRPYEVLEGFTYEEAYEALCSGRIDLIWIEGPSLGTNVEVE